MLGRVGVAEPDHGNSRVLHGQNVFHIGIEHVLVSAIKQARRPHSGVRSDAVGE